MSFNSGCCGLLNFHLIFLYIPLPIPTSFYLAVSNSVLIQLEYLQMIMKRKQVRILKESVVASYKLLPRNILIKFIKIFGQKTW